MKQQTIQEIACGYLFTFQALSNEYSEKASQLSDRYVQAMERLGEHYNNRLEAAISRLLGLK